MEQSIWAVVVAAGSGTRFGRPKQFDLLGGRPVVEWSVAAARSIATGVVLVLPPGRVGTDPAAAAPAFDRAQRPHAFGADSLVAGGDTRSESVRRGLDAVPSDADIVVVHDAARPMASASLFAAVVAPLLGAERPVPGEPAVAGVVCALPVTDTLKRVDANGATTTVSGTLDRSGLVAVQTPQAFRADVLRRAHAAGRDATDDAALIEAIGGTVWVVPGEARNIKLTTPDDLAYLEHLLVDR